MERDQLVFLAESLHKKFGKKFHSTKEALEIILPIWETDNQIAYSVLFGMASSGAGKKKSHVSAKVDSEGIRVAFGYHSRKK